MPFVSLHDVMVRCGSSICVGRHSMYVNPHVNVRLLSFPTEMRLGGGRSCGWLCMWVGGMAVQSARRVFNECGSSR
jgi:hypothetical protein